MRELNTQTQLGLGASGVTASQNGSQQATKVATPTNYNNLNTHPHNSQTQAQQNHNQNQTHQNIHQQEVPLVDSKPTKSTSNGPDSLGLPDAMSYVTTTHKLSHKRAAAHGLTQLHTGKTIMNPQPQASTQQQLQENNSSSAASSTALPPRQSLATSHSGSGKVVMHSKPIISGANHFTMVSKPDSPHSHDSHDMHDMNGYNSSGNTKHGDEESSLDAVSWDNTPHVTRTARPESSEHGLIDRLGASTISHDAPGATDSAISGRANSADCSSARDKQVVVTAVPVGSDNLKKEGKNTLDNWKASSLADRMLPLSLNLSGGGTGKNSGAGTLENPNHHDGDSVSPSIKSANPSPTEEWAKINNNIMTVSPNQLLGYLHTDNVQALASKNNMQSNGNHHHEKLKNNVLCIDLRGFEDFQELRIKNSINLSLPPLIIKRARKGIFPNPLNIASFLTNKTSKRIYEDWLLGLSSLSSSDDPNIIIYDEDMDETTHLSDAWDLVTLTMKSPILDCPIKPQIAYLKGGFEAFKKTSHDDLMLFMEGSCLTPSSATTNSDMLSPSSGLPILNSQSPLSASPLQRDTPSTPNFASPISSTSAHSDISSPSSSTAASASTSATAFSKSSQRKRSSFSINVTPSSKGFPSRTGSLPINAPLSELPDVIPESPGANTAVASTPSDPYTPSNTKHLGILEPYSVIYPYLFLGSEEIPTSPDAIQRLKGLCVTHVLNMAIEVKAPALIMHSNESIKYKHLGVEDHPDQDIEAAMVEGVEYIEQARKENPNAIILVHCKAGKSRSATIVIAYLIKKLGMTLRDSYDHVRRMRNGICPNIGFMLALMRLETETLGTSTEVAYSD